MLENKEIPKEFVGVRQVWLSQINRCNEAISNRYMADAKDQYSSHIGEQTLIETVMALFFCLVDYGEATIKTDVDKWRKEVLFKMKDPNSFIAYGKFFEYIIKTLNKYGMLFESQPQGYSNVEMKSTCSI